MGRSLRIDGDRHSTAHRTDVTEVYLVDGLEKVVSALDMLGIYDSRDARVPIKLHMGEPGNWDMVCASKISDDDILYKALMCG